MFESTIYMHVVVTKLCRKLLVSDGSQKDLRDQTLLRSEESETRRLRHSLVSDVSGISEGPQMLFRIYYAHWEV